MWRLARIYQECKVSGTTAEGQHRIDDCYELLTYRVDALSVLAMAHHVIWCAAITTTIETKPQAVLSTWRSPCEVLVHSQAMVLLPVGGGEACGRLSSNTSNKDRESSYDSGLHLA